jgi:signal transduction histidine kinase
MMELISKKIRGSRRAAIFSEERDQTVEQMIRYAQIGKLSSGLLHDLTSPITALNLQLQTMDSESLKDSEWVKALKDAIVNIDSYSQLIKVYISGNKKKKEVNLEKEIKRALKLISYRAIKNRIQIQFIKQKGIKMFANKVQIYQIIISLVSNAIESFRECDSDRKIIIKLEKIKDRILILVKDFGGGIDNTKKIFSPFYTTKIKDGGTGIGLSNVKHIVEQEYGGKIKVISEKEKGSTFVIII